MLPTRIGIIGAGSVAARHAESLSTFDDVQIVAVADPAIEVARALADSYGAAAYPGHEGMLEGGGLDAIYICVPPFAHGAPERDAIAAGLPFFVEKPVAIDVASAEGIEQAVRDTGVLTATGYWWRHLDIVDRAADLVADDPARLAVGTWIGAIAPPSWWIRRDRSGGQFVEQATHVVDLLRLLVGEIDQVWATGAPCALPDADIDDVAAATLRFTNGAIGSLVSTCALGWKHNAGVQLYGSNVALELTETQLCITVGGTVECVPQIRDAKTLADRAFVDAVRGRDDDIRAPYGEALATHRIACALAQSSGNGEPVRLLTDA